MKSAWPDVILKIISAVCDRVGILGPTLYKRESMSESGAGSSAEHPKHEAGRPPVSNTGSMNPAHRLGGDFLLQTFFI